MVATRRGPLHNKVKEWLTVSTSTNTEEVIQVETMKLSTLVLTVSPDLYDLLKEEELNSHIVIRGDVSSIGPEDLNEIIARTIEYHHSAPYH